MNRRSFLKRIAAVAAGAVAAPVAVKTLFFKPNPAQHNILYTWEFSRLGSPYGYDPPSKPSKYPDYELGTLYHASNGAIYRYIKKLRK